MSKQVAHIPQLDFEQLRKAIRQEYTEVALRASPWMNRSGRQPGLH
jgi:hypothetical protein